MMADYMVELGREDAILEVPWSSPDGTLRYFDLRDRPELLLEVQETFEYPELADFLSKVNSFGSLQSAKCDVWTTDQLTEVERIFCQPWKFGSYVDLFFVEHAYQLSLPSHVDLAKAITDKLARVPDFPAAIDIFIRRCYFHRTTDIDNSEDGYCLSIYISGYGESEIAAQAMWAIAQMICQNALIQLTAHQKSGLE